MSDQLGYLYTGRLCHIHLVGRGPGEPITYHPGCAECVRRRGHLPEVDRDVAGDPVLFRRFMNMYGAAAGRPVLSKSQRKRLGLPATGNWSGSVSSMNSGVDFGDRPELQRDERALPGVGGPGDERDKAAA